MGVIHKDNPLHTYKRKGSDVYQFQIRVPKTLKHLFDSKTHIRFSLKTRDASEAKRLALVHAAKYTQDFARLQAEIDTAKLNIHNRLQLIPVDSANTWTQLHLNYVSESPDLSNTAVLMGLDVELESHHDMLESITSDGLSSSGLFRSAQWNAFTQCVSHRDKDGLTSLSPAAKARLYIEFVSGISKVHPTLTQKLANPIATDAPLKLSKPETQHGLRSVFDEFLANKNAETKGGLSLKLEQRYTSSYESLAGLLGEDTPITDVTRADMRELRDTLAVCPSNHKKHKDTRNLDMQTMYTLAKSGALSHLPTLSVTTVNQRLEALSSMFRFAVHERYITTNPSEGIRLKKQVADKDSRNPWSVEGLTRLLRESVGTKHCWTVRLGLCGLRMNEIVQLTKEDVRQDNSGLWFIDVNKEDGKKVKTLSSVRLIPVPTRFIELGFLDFVSACNTSTLFDINPSASTGYRSDVYSKSFAYFTKTKGIREDRVSFHSLRHNFKDAALAADVPEAAYKQLGGWTEDSVSGNYGSGYPLDRLKTYMDRLDWSLL